MFENWNIRRICTCGPPWHKNYPCFADSKTYIKPILSPVRSRLHLQTFKVKNHRCQHVLEGHVGIKNKKRDVLGSSRTKLQLIFNGDTSWHKDIHCFTDMRQDIDRISSIVRTRLHFETFNCETTYANLPQQVFQSSQANRQFFRQFKKKHKTQIKRFSKQFKKTHQRICVCGTPGTRTFIVLQIIKRIYSRCYELLERSCIYLLLKLNPTDANLPWRVFRSSTTNKEIYETQFKKKGTYLLQ